MKLTISATIRAGLTVFGVGAVVMVVAQEPVASPLANSRAAAEEGRFIYLRYCQQCHDADGRALANIDHVAADLTAPDTWYYGTEPLNIFFSIKNGAGLQMPPFQDALDDESIWKIVAHIRNIGPQETRPTAD